MHTNKKNVDISSREFDHVSIFDPECLYVESFDPDYLDFGLLRPINLVLTHGL